MYPDALLIAAITWLYHHPRTFAAIWFAFAWAAFRHGGTL